MNSERVHVEVADHVATVTLTRPTSTTRWTSPMFEGIIGAAERLCTEPGVRAVVSTARPSFCSGLDLASLVSAGAGMDGDGRAAARASRPTGSSAPPTTGSALPVPVIAAMHGNCFGGGLQIALAADIRIATPDARLSVMEIRWGLIPDMSITRTLPRLVGIDVAKELDLHRTGLHRRGGAPTRRRDARGRRSTRRRASSRPRSRPIPRRHPRRQAAVRRGVDRPAGQTLALEAEIQRALIGSPESARRGHRGDNKQPAEFVDPESLHESDRRGTGTRTPTSTSRASACRRLHHSPGPACGLSNGKRQPGSEVSGSSRASSATVRMNVRLLGLPIEPPRGGGQPDALGPRGGRPAGAGGAGAARPVLELGEEIAAIGQSVLEIAERLDRAGRRRSWCWANG